MIYAVYRCLYGEDFIRPSIMSIEPYVDKIFVFWTDRVWGNATSCVYRGETLSFPPDGKFDRILEKLDELKCELLDKLVIQQDHVVNNRNQFTHLVNDLILPKHPKPDILIMMEVDYVWREDQIEKALSEFVHSPFQHASSSQVELWKTFEYQAIRNDPNRRAAMFWDFTNLDEMPQTNRHADALGMGRLESYVHNLGFCASESSIYWKHLTALGYTQKIGECPPNEAWFENIWKAWDFETNNKNLEMSAGYEHLISKAILYSGQLPETLIESYPC